QQREQIFQRTGITLATLPYESDASTVRYPFGGIILHVVRGVFTPTPASERLLHLVREAVDGRDRPTIIDAGTGCGAVALAAAAAMPNASIYGTEISELAVRCARRNRRRLGLRHVQLRCGSILEPVPN